MKFSRLYVDVSRCAISNQGEDDVKYHRRESDSKVSETKNNNCDATSKHGMGRPQINAQRPQRKQPQRVEVRI